MKGTEKKAIGRAVLNTGLSFLKGMVGGINPIVGMVVGAGEGIVKGVQKEKDKNLATTTGGAGMIDPAHLAGVGVFVVLVGLLASGLISMEQLKELIKIFLKTQ